MKLKQTTKKAIIICCILSSIGLLATLYLRTLVNTAGNHRDLFATKVEKVILQPYWKLLFSLPLLIPVAIQRHWITLTIGLLSVPFFLFLHFSRAVFAD